MSLNNSTRNHKWSVADDEAALEAYVNGLTKKEADEIAASRGIKPSSFWCRIGNFQYLASEGKKGFSNYAKQSERVWEAYKKSLASASNAMIKEQAK